ncbi:hypothetical protein FIBSPDRAFT_861344 [Athelia psychrophila]|uniref:PIN domain-containing protein n=1 Tax=Athelia psychrophila TaxID=1759441 RepID=A0A166JI73_9AGAM|nr:hypothetical protein FIBSPDRAFT_861344 [Fibularhizoctonia sp. CBS 109695]
MARPSSTNGGRPTPTPKASADYVSASSTSSYAPSLASSSFTLSSGTTESSAGSALFDRKPSEEPGNNAFAVQLKKLYRGISSLETRILTEDAEDAGVDEGRVLLKTREKEVVDEDAEKQKWRKRIDDHKRLAEMMHNLLEISLAPSVPASLRNIPTKYNIIIRLWSHAFHKLLESLRRASFASPLALEHLQDFIYYAYTFYTGILEEQTLRPFRAGWLEALGDLARYRMAVAAMVTGSQGSGPEELTAAAVASALLSASPAPSLPPSSAISAKSNSISGEPMARIDDSPSPSVGVAAARMMNVEPEKELWRGIARDWYAQGLADTPGTGKLHHHLGVLSREKEGEELRALYHFIKSMTVLHPFSTSRESVLPLWSSAAQQARLSSPSTSASDLFILLHGMMFTNIQLDDFHTTIARFLERLEMEGEGVEVREWIMMGVINLGSVLEYGKASGVIRNAGGFGAREGTNLGSAGVRVVVKRATTIAEDDESRMDVDSLGTGIQASPANSEIDEAAYEYPAAFTLAAKLAFTMLSHVLKRPTRKASPFARSTINPYVTVLLTFLTTLTKQPATLAAIDKLIPWEELAAFFMTVPSTVIHSQGLASRSKEPERRVMLTTGCTPPLAEDWCLHGMEWVGRRVFERGYWKSGEEKSKEVEVLDASEDNEVTDGIIEDEDDEDDNSPSHGGSGTEIAKRWIHIVRCAVGMAHAVDGFTWVEGTKEWRVEGALSKKVLRWKEEERLERQAEEKRRMGTRWTDEAMDVDEDDVVASESDEEDDQDVPEVKALKARRRYLQSLVQSADRGTPSPVAHRARPRMSRQDPPSRAALPIVPGYSVLVVDTNILLSSLSMLASVIESLRWTVIVPLPVIMELDGISANTSQPGETTKPAMSYLTSHVRSHSTSLKVQTSKGNYLTSLTFRTEQVDFKDEASWERNMDDLILRTAIWQDDHWSDRSSMLKNTGAQRGITVGAVKVVLLSLDRNLRLKARSRQLPAASETDLAAILATGT